MKNHIARLVILMGLACLTATGLSGCGSQDVESEEDFLKSVRAAAEEAPAPDYESPTLLVTADGPMPKIELETEHYQLGEIPNDALGKGSVKIYNRGGAALHIKRITTTCSCTIGRVEQDIVEPGESVDLFIEVDPAKIPGFHATRVLTINSNDPTMPMYALMVSADVKPEVSIEPERVDLGTIQAGMPAQRRFRLRQLTDDALEVYNARCLHNFVDVELSEVPRDQWRVPDHREFDLVLSVRPDAPIGRLDGKLIVETNLRRIRRLNYGVSGAVYVNPYTIMPRTAQFSGAKAGDTIEGAFELTSDRFIRINSIRSDGDKLELLTQEQQGTNRLTLDIVVRQGDASQTWIVSFEINGITYVEKLSATVGNPATPEEAND